MQNLVLLYRLLKISKPPSSAARSSWPTPSPSAKPRQGSHSKLFRPQQLLKTPPSDPNDPDSIDGCSSQVLRRQISHRSHNKRIVFFFILPWVSYPGIWMVITPILKNYSFCWCLQETHLLPEHHLHLRRYACYRNDTDDGLHAHSGVAILVHDSVHSQEIALQFLLPVVAVRVTMTYLSFIVCSLYIHPG